MPDLSRSQQLKRELEEVDAWMNASAFVKWQEARDEEAAMQNRALAYTAQTAADIVMYRTLRENILSIKDSFEGLRDNLKQALDQAIEEETQIAATAKV